MATPTVIEKQEIYKNHPRLPKDENGNFIRDHIPMWYYPNSHAYKIDGDKKIGVSTVKDIIKSDGLAHYFKAEAIKYFRRKLIPMNDGKLVLPTAEEFEEMCKAAGSAHMDKSQRGIDAGNLADEWLEKYLIAHRDGTDKPAPLEPMEVVKKDKVEVIKSAADFDLPDKDADKYKQDPWLYEVDKQLAFERNNLVKALEEFVEWMGEHEVEVVKLQGLIYSLRYDYAGRFDAILRIDGKLYLVDFKTNNPAWEYPKGVFPDMFCQLGGYDVGYTEENYPDLDAKNESCFDGHAIFNFNKQTGKFYREFSFDVKVNRAWFIHTLGTKRGFQHHMRNLSLKYKENRPETKKAKAARGAK